MSDNYALRELDPDARRQHCIWNGAAVGTNGGGTKYFDGPISAPSNANPCYQIVKAGTAKMLEVRVAVNGSGAGTITISAKALLAAGSTLTLGSVVYNGGEVGVKTAVLTGALDAGALLFVDAVSNASFTSTNVIGSALIEYWTSI